MWVAAADFYVTAMNWLSHISSPFPSQSLSRQSSLAEDRINSSDEDEYLEERSGGMCEISESRTTASPSTSSAFTHEPSASSSRHDNASHNMSAFDGERQQPDLIREVLALKLSSDSNDDDALRLLENFTPTPASVDDENCHMNGSKFGHKIKKSEYFIKVNGDASRMMARKRRRRGIFAKSSCIAQWIWTRELSVFPLSRARNYNVKLKWNKKFFRFHSNLHAPYSLISELKKAYRKLNGVERNLPTHESARVCTKIKLDDREEQQQQQWKMSDDGSCLELRWQTQLREDVSWLLFRSHTSVKLFKFAMRRVACCSRIFFWKVCDNLRNVIMLIRKKKSAVDEWFNDMKWETQWNNEHNTQFTRYRCSHYISETFHQLHATHNSSVWLAFSLILYVDRLQFSPIWIKLIFDLSRRKSKSWTLSACKCYSCCAVEIK